MKKLFNFSRGEFWATIALLSLITLSLLFYFFYDKKEEPLTDLTTYAPVVQDFQRRQSHYADSLAQARNNYAPRQRYYENRYSDSQRNYSNSSYRDSTKYRRDTTRLAPIERKQLYTIHKLDLNNCDTSDIVTIPQFGSKRAAKLVEYRDKLGGFSSFAQIHEIYVLQNISLEHCEKYFVINPHSINQIKINSASYKELIAHPYFDAYLTKQIVNYRDKNGRITDLNHLKEITHAYPELLAKLKPYLSFE